MNQMTRRNSMQRNYWGDPFESLDRMFNEAFNQRLMDWNSGRTWSLPLDVVEKEDAYVVKASIPGMDPDALDITFTDNVLTINAQTRQESDQEDENYMLRERHFGSFTRTITFPMPIEADNVEATCTNGELTLRLPKAETARPRRITINGGRGRRVIEGQNNPSSQGWTEGQSTRPEGAVPGSKGWEEGQSTRPEGAIPGSKGWEEGQANTSRS